MSRFLNFVAKGQHYALPVEFVQEILAIKLITEIPSRLPALRGGINVRGGILPLYDFRTLLGMPKLLKEREELVSILNQREQDHIDWLEALKKSVSDGVEFRKAIDPRSCAFGKWYYSFKAPDTSVERTLADFEKPHNEIHALAQTVLGLASSGAKSEALCTIETARSSTLSRLLRLFADLKTTLVSDVRELAVICKTSDDRLVAIAVDGVENIRDLEQEKYRRRDGLEAGSVVSNIWSTDKQTVMELQMGKLQQSLSAL